MNTIMVSFQEEYLQQLIRGKPYEIISICKDFIIQISHK